MKGLCSLYTICLLYFNIPKTGKGKCRIKWFRSGKERVRKVNNVCKHRVCLLYASVCLFMCELRYRVWQHTHTLSMTLLLVLWKELVYRKWGYWLYRDVIRVPGVSLVSMWPRFQMYTSVNFSMTTKYTLSGWRSSAVICLLCAVHYISVLYVRISCSHNVSVNLNKLPIPPSKHIFYSFVFVSL